jgi:hypothetical protein
MFSAGSGIIDGTAHPVAENSNHDVAVFNLQGLINLALSPTIVESRDRGGFPAFKFKYDRFAIRFQQRVDMVDHVLHLVTFSLDIAWGNQCDPYRTF